jgi:hypothetical protein
MALISSMTSPMRATAVTRPCIIAVVAPACDTALEVTLVAAVACWPISSTDIDSSSVAVATLRTLPIACSAAVATSLDCRSVSLAAEFIRLAFC